MKTIPLSQLGEINPRMPASVSALSDDEVVTFLPMAGVSEEGSVKETDARTLGEVARGYRYFERGDVLLAKITPCMENGKAAHVHDISTQVGFGSTEFHVIRPLPGVDPKYVFHSIWNPRFRHLAKDAMTGAAGQKRVPTDFLKTYQVPALPLPEQQRIVAILDKADEIRRKRAETIRIAADFLKSTFLDMFGDPVTNPKGWPTPTLGAVGILDRGKSRHRPRNDPELLGGPHPLIQTGDIAGASLYLRNYSQTYSDIGLAQSRMWPAGTLCITIAANIAKTAILTFDACFPDSVVGFTPGKNVRTEYIQCWLSFLQAMLEASAPESAQKNINLAILRDLTLPLPPRGLQDAFASLQDRTEASLANLRAHNAESDALFNALSQRAFQGEL